MEVIDPALASGDPGAGFLAAPCCRAGGEGRPGPVAFLDADERAEVCRHCCSDGGEGGFHATHAQRDVVARERLRVAQPPEYQQRRSKQGDRPGAPVELGDGDHQQRERDVLGEVGVGADSCLEIIVLARAEAHAVLAPQGYHPESEADVQDAECRCRDGCNGGGRQC